MRILALLRPLTIRDVRAWLVQDITTTVQAFALSMFLLSVIGIAVAPQLRVEMEFCMVGICVISALVLLANDLRQEVGTAIWFGAISSMLVSADLTDVVSRTLMIIFAFACLCFMWYVTPWPRTQGSD